MMSVPVFAFVGYSGSGKTTVIVKIIRNLKDKGLRMAVVKHDGHSFEIDHDGKDSRIFSEAGAIVSVITSKDKTAMIEHRPRVLEDLLSRIEHVDIVLIEGFKNASLPKIGVSRRACGKGLPHEPEQYVAIVTDEEITTSVPVFSPNDIDGITEFLMKNSNDFTHLNVQGRAKMVDVGEKEITRRTSIATARVCVNRDTFNLIQSGGSKKGDVLAVAQIAGIMGAKRTADLIPMCHPVGIDGIDLSLELNEKNCCVDIFATVSCDGRTGVEMEALTAASTAALTVYDMCKAVQRDIEITNIRLLSKTGGIHGDYHGEDFEI